MADAVATGVLRGNTLTLDAPVPALEGQRVRVIIARDGEDLALSAEERAASWDEWARREPQGPIEDHEAHHRRVPPHLAHVRGSQPEDFGKLVGMSVANVWDIEKGRKGVSPEKAGQIANAGVPPALLVRLSIEESLLAAGLKYSVEVKSAA